MKKISALAALSAVAFSLAAFAAPISLARSPKKRRNAAL